MSAKPARKGSATRERKVSRAASTMRSRVAEPFRAGFALMAPYPSWCHRVGRWRHLWSGGRGLIAPGAARVVPPQPRAPAVASLADEHEEPLREGGQGRAGQSI